MADLFTNNPYRAPPPAPAAGDAQPPLNVYGQGPVTASTDDLYTDNPYRAPPLSPDQDESNPAYWRAKTVSEMNPFEIAGAAFDHALVSTGTGIKGLVADLEQFDPGSDKAYWKGVSDSAKQAQADASERFAPIEANWAGKAGNFAGNVAPWLAFGPGAGGSAMLRLLAAGGMGALQGGAQPLMPGQGWGTRLGNAALGAGGGVTGFGVGEALGAQASKALPSIFETAAPQLPADVAARAAAYQTIGIKPAVPQLTRDPSDWTAWTEAGKRNGPAGEMFKAQQEQTQDALSNVLPGAQADPGAKAGAMTYLAQRVARAYKQDATNAARGVYNAVPTAEGANTRIPWQPFYDSIKPTLDLYQGQIPKSISDRLEAFRQNDLIESGGIPMQPGAGPIVPPQEFTVGAAAKLYQDINDVMGPGLGNTSRAGRALKLALAQGADGMPDVPAANMFRDATNQWRELQTNLTPAPIKALAGARDVTPEYLSNLVTKGIPSEITTTQKFLTAKDPTTSGLLRDVMLKEAQDAAYPNPSGGFSARGLGKFMDSVGDERLSAVLSPSDMATLRTLRTASEGATVPPIAASSNTSNTAATLANQARAAHGGTLTGTIVGSAVEPLVERLTGIPGVAPILGAAVGRWREGMAGRNAAEQMRQMLNPDMESLAARLNPQAAPPWYSLRNVTLPTITGQVGGALGVQAPPFFARSLASLFSQ